MLFLIINKLIDNTALLYCQNNATCRTVLRVDLSKGLKKLLLQCSKSLAAIFMVIFNEATIKSLLVLCVPFYQGLI